MYVWHVYACMHARMTYGRLDGWIYVWIEGEGEEEERERERKRERVRERERNIAREGSLLYTCMHARMHACGLSVFLVLRSGECIARHVCALRRKEALRRFVFPWQCEMGIYYLQWQCGMGIIRSQ